MPDPDRFARHGRLRVSVGRTHLAHADGTPFFYLADTAWNGPLLSGDADWGAYLDDRAAKGFTAIQFVAHAPWTAALTDRDGRAAFTGDAAAPLDAAFFDRLDAKVAAINDRGLLAVPVLAWAANFGPSRRLNVGHVAGARELIPIVRAQVERLAKHHVLFVLAGDGVYNVWRARKWKQVGRAVFADLPAPPDRPPVTLHPAGQSWPYARFADEPWLDLYGYQSSHSEDRKSLRWLQAGPPASFWKQRPRPTINLEPVYEDIGRPPFDAAAVRRAAYWSLLNAPTAGVAYGAHGLWGWHESAGEALNHRGLGVGQPWRVAMNLPGSHDMARLAGFFTSIDWWTLRPAPQLLEEQPHPGDPARYVAASAAADASLAVVYFPGGGGGGGGGGAIVLRGGGVDAGWRGTWFDPRTGGRSAAAIGGDRRVAPPDAGDWLLLLRAGGGA